MTSVADDSDDHNDYDVDGDYVQLVDDYTTPVISVCKASIVSQLAASTSPQNVD